MRERIEIESDVETLLDKPVLELTDVAHSNKIIIECLLDIREMLWPVRAANMVDADELDLMPR